MGRKAVAAFAGLAIGVLLAGIVGPIILSPLGINLTAAASIGSVVGAVAGYLLSILVLRVVEYRRNAELRRAVEAVKTELHLPASVMIRVKDRLAVLEGEVANYSQRQQAERAISTIPGIRNVTNRLRLRPAAASVSTSPDEIRERIAEQIVRLAYRAIQVDLCDSDIVLEGTGSFPRRGVRGRKHGLGDSRSG
jgi:hypothetical protein